MAEVVATVVPIFLLILVGWILRKRGLPGEGFWAPAEWLTYYELWHLTGTWLAPGVGYESVARMMRADAEAVKAVLADVH